MKKIYQPRFLQRSTLLLIMIGLLSPSGAFALSQSQQSPSLQTQSTLTSKTKKAIKVKRKKKSTAQPSSLSSPDLMCNQLGYNYVGEWGTPGNGNSQFNFAHGITTDTEGNIYTADTFNHRVQKFSPTGLYITQWGSLGTNLGQFNRPTDIATDSLNNVYVVDKTNLRIQKFAPDGGYITTWGPSFGDNDKFSKTINGIGINVANNNVYVVDTGNNRIIRFSANGQYLGKFGKLGTGNGMFRGPQDVTVDANGNVYVTDTLNNRIQKFSATGDYLNQWGTPGIANGQFNSPTGIDADNNGNIFIVDSSNSRIQKFSNDGVFLDKWGSNGNGPAQFKGATYITNGALNNAIYVSDTENNRIQIFDTTCSKIIIQKFVVPTPDPTDFSFTSNFAPTFLLDHDADPTLSNTATFLLPGSGGVFTTKEENNPNYTVFLNCADPTGDTLMNGAIATMNVAPGETVTCIYRNTCVNPNGCF